MYRWDHLLWHIKASMMCKDPSSRFQQDAKVKNWSFLEESSLNQWFVKTQKRDRTPSVLSLWAKCTQNDGEHGVWSNKWSCLNFGKGRRSLLWSFVPKAKTPDYYHRTRRGLGYVSTPIPSASKSEESLYHIYSSGTSTLESDVSVVNIFRELSVNMVSTSHLEDGDEEMIQSDTDPWIKHLNTLGYSFRTTRTTHGR